MAIADLDGLALAELFKNRLACGWTPAAPSRTSANTGADIGDAVGIRT